MRHVRIGQRPRASKPDSARLRPLLRQDPMTPLSDGRCIFWSLPTELREVIYSYAWHDGRIIVGRLGVKDGKSKIDGDRQLLSPERHDTERATAYLNDLLISNEFYNEAKCSMLRHATVVFDDYIPDVQVRQLVRCSNAEWARKYIQSIEVSRKALNSPKLSSKHFPQLRHITVVHCWINHFGLDVIPGHSASPLDVHSCYDLRRIEPLEECELLEHLTRFTMLRSIRLVIPDCTICQEFDLETWLRWPEDDSPCHLSQSLALSMEMYVLSNILSKIKGEAEQNIIQMRQLEEVSARQQTVTQIVGDTIADGIQEEIDAMQILWPPSYE